MSVADLLAKLHARGVRVRLDGDDVKVTGWPLVRPAERETLRQERETVRELLREATVEAPAPDPAPEEEPDLASSDAKSPDGREIVGERVSWDRTLGRRVTPIYRTERERLPDPRKLARIQRLARRVLPEPAASRTADLPNSRTRPAGGHRTSR